MTPEAAEELMNKFYDNEATDAEARELFLYLSQSEDARSLFIAMNTVQDALRSRPVGTIPSAVDQRLSALLMTPPRSPFMQRTIAVSMPSAILSAFVVCLMTLMLFITVSRSSASRPPVDQRTEAVSMYFGGTDRDHVNEH
jgi:hypothetical protein